MATPRPREGIIGALPAALLFGLSAPVGKKLLGDVSPLLLAGLFYLGSGIGLGAFWIMRRRSFERAEAQLGRADLPVRRPRSVSAACLHRSFCWPDSSERRHQPRLCF